MKQRIFAVFAAFLCAALGACTGTEPATGTPIVTASSKAAFPAAQAMDGDADTGWVCAKKANTANFQKLDIDFGATKTFDTITLDDGFAGGFTNKRPEYVSVSAGYRSGNATSLSPGSSVSACLGGSADGRGWQSSAIPTPSSPEKLWISLSEAVSVTKLTLDNAMFNSAMRSFALYASPVAVPRASAFDPETEGYALLAEATENDENVVEVKTKSPTVVHDVLLIVREQHNEGQSVEASLDELFFYGAVPDDYTEAHYPVQFVFMLSDNGKNYDVIAEETNNYSPVWTKTLDKRVSGRYVRYLVYEELNNNYPSAAEFRFETR